MPQPKGSIPYKSNNNLLNFPQGLHHYSNIASLSSSQTALQRDPNMGYTDHIVLIRRTSHRHRFRIYDLSAPYSPQYFYGTLSFLQFPLTYGVIVRYCQNKCSDSCDGTRGDLTSIFLYGVLHTYSIGRQCDCALARLSSYFFTVGLFVALVTYFRVLLQLLPESNARGPSHHLGYLPGIFSRQKRVQNYLPVEIQPG